jgi:hypothetical protein
MWGTKAKILFCNSRSKPFITDNTVISMATPRLNPVMDNKEITPINIFFERTEEKRLPM